MILPYIMKLTNLILILADYFISIFLVERCASGIQYDNDTILCDTLPYVTGVKDLTNYKIKKICKIKGPGV